MMTGPERECPIWQGYPARCELIEGKIAWHVDSPRAGGRFDISWQAKLGAASIDASAKARLTTRLINHRRQTGRPLTVTESLLEEARSGLISLEVPERAHRLLECLVKSSSSIGKEVCLLAGPKVGVAPSATRGMPQALAWSESTTDDELKFLCNELIGKQWVRATRPPTDSAYCVMVTAQGYEAVRNPPLPDSEHGFVAMWLHESMEEVYESGLRPAIEDAGYKAVRIDRELHVDKIDDDVLAGIRKSRFVLADFTHGDDGVRGSVYFEAGFARGLGIKVISTCREDQIDKLQFDTRQYHHIAWKPDALDKLRREVGDRIGARVGAAAPGPGHPDS